MEAFADKRHLLMWQSKLHSAYVSCWHRLNENSDLIKLGKEYAQGAFQCAVTTSIENIQLSIPSPDGIAMWLDLVDVKYIPDESLRLEEVLDGEYPRCGYPELMFKRHKCEYEQEARFVMHDHTASTVFPGAKVILASKRPERRYAAIDSNQFIDDIYLLNDDSFLRVNKFLLGIKHKYNIIQSTPDILQNMLVGTE